MVRSSCQSGRLFAPEAGLYSTASEATGCYARLAEVILLIGSQSIS